MIRPVSCAAAFVALFAGTAFAQPWPEQPDATFGDRGVRLFDSVATEVAQVWATSDERVLALVRATSAAPSLPRDPGGAAGLWRLNADATADRSFGLDGRLRSTEACVAPCAIQRAELAGDRIHVVEGSDDVAARTVRRLRSDGTLDRSWGNGGTAQGLDARFVPLDLAALPSGAVVVAGVSDPSNAASLVVVRIGADGSIDRAFGVDGHADTGLQGIGPMPKVRVAVDGRILVLRGDRLVRLDAAGRRDASFGAGGIVDLLAIGLIGADFVIEPPTERILVAGSRNEGGAEPALSMLVAALGPQGTLDASYGVDGIARIGTDRPDDLVATGAVLDAQGRLIVVGYAGHATFLPFDVELHRAVVARLLPAGAPDPNFAPGGSTAFWSGAGSEAMAVASTASGRLIVGGTSHLPPVYAGKSPDYRPRAAAFALTGGSSRYARPLHESVAFEFLHAGFGHYFLTTNPDEARKLDAASDWARTGLAFNVWPEGSPERTPVCRFWSGQRFAPRSSHFYTPYEAECLQLQRDRTWDLEGMPFTLRLPQGVEGTRTCPIDSRPLYRAYNDGAGGAPNHRYTIDASVLDAMVARGWIVEGEAETRVFACVPVQ